MGLSAECIVMLEHMNKPAFFSDDVIVIHANNEAKQIGINNHTALSDILGSLTDESQILTKPINDIYYTVSCACVGEFKLYILDRSLQQQQLQSLLRAAQHLRMPLAALTSSVNSLKDQFQDLDDPDVISSMQKATKQLFSLQRTVRNMSDVTDFFTTRYSKLQTVNIIEHVQELAEKLSANFEKTNVNITYTVEDDYEYCSIDTELLERAVYNMISNSLKANSQNIHISLSRHTQYFHLTVTDDGHGISNEDKSSILSKFKEEPSLNFEKSGLGLGMLIIHAAAIAHNGTVLIADAEPHGCKITLTIEINKSHSSVKQSPILLQVDPMGGIDPMIIELAEYLPWHLF